MVIISQNKNRIINFDNILEIWIDSNILDKTEPAFTINAETDSTVIEIGNYATEKRAKEVLQEITEFWRNGAMTDCKGFICYEMPER